MSGTEHIDERVVCENLRGETFGNNQFFHNENAQDLPSLYFELSSGRNPPVYPNSVRGEPAMDDCNLTDWDVGNYFGEQLNPLLTTGEELGMLDNNARICDSAGLGIRMSNCTSTRQADDGVTRTNDVTQQLSVPKEESFAKRLNFGNVEKLDNSLGLEGTLVGDTHMNDNGSSYGPAENHGQTLSSVIDENYIHVTINEGNQVSTCDITTQAQESVSHMQSVIEDHALCLESETCDRSALQNTVVNESVEGELPHPCVALPNMVVHKLDSEVLISSVEMPYQLNVQNGPIDPGVGSSRYVVCGPSGQNLCLVQRTEEEQQVFGVEHLSNQPLEEKNGTYVQTDRTAKGNREEDSHKSNHDNLDVDSHCTFLEPEANSSRVKQEPETLVEGNHETLQSEHSEQKVKAASEAVASDIKETQNTKSNLNVVGSAPVDGAHKSLVEEKETPHHGLSKSLCGIKQNSPNASDAMDCPSRQTGALSSGTSEKLNVVVLGLLASVDGAQKSLVKEKKAPCHGLSKSLSGTMQNSPDVANAKDCPSRQTGPLSVGASEKLNVVVLGMPANAINENARREHKHGKTPTVFIEKKYSLRSSKDCTRAPPPRSLENPVAPQPSTNLENTTGNSGSRKGKKKMEMKGKTHDEFARMRKHLRYLLHRIQCEQNLLDAYSSEGWRGQSIEKLRPEKELQRAKADINRSKLKIRNLFQHLDSLACEGKFPNSLFDSEGLIDSEDIFCAKCGSKDSAIHNDIILCDGACDRGFHQYCLEPPLRTEEIPPGDEGWLCPACDCKIDCLQLLNDSHRTKLSIQDSWEKVFPDIAAAAAAVVGSEHDNMMGLPSDDSEDNDYNPDGTDDDDEVEGSKSSSDESGSAKSDSSDFSSASEDVGGVCVSEQYLGFPSDDSEDDDYNPDTANVDEHDEHESSSSDFRSSEDLGVPVDVDVDVDGSSVGHELPLSLLEQDQDTGEIPSVSGRRHVKRLDYKKLYDETFGNASSDSSDDEEWTGIDTTKKRKGSSRIGVSASSIADTSAPIDSSVSVGASRKRGQKKLNLQATTGSPAQLTKSSQKIGSSGKSMEKLPPNRLGEVATQKLYESFKKNQYPDREMKEKLAKELGLTAKRVDKWFSNARWSFNHHRVRMEASMAAATSCGNTSHDVAHEETGSPSFDANTAVSKNHRANSSEQDTNEGDQRTTPKRKKNEDDQPILQSVNGETSLEGTRTNKLQTLAAQQGVQRKRRKSRA